VVLVVALAVAPGGIRAVLRGLLVLLPGVLLLVVLLLVVLLLVRFSLGELPHLKKISKFFFGVTDS
jgi:hypothetical protein